MRPIEQIKERANQLAYSHFHCENGEVWEPFYGMDEQELAEKEEDLADMLCQAMTWAATPYSQNEFRRDNLKKLADHLASLPEGYREFDMQHYVTTSGGSSDRRPSEVIPGCGTICCAAGHGPLIGIKAHLGEDWTVYIDRVFLDDNSIADFSWMFSGQWTQVDNTPQGAALRINWYLEHGAPSDYRQQMRGEAPLCYRGAQ